MTPICLHDRGRLAAFFRRNPALHAYALGDLDDFFWPHTQWYGLEEKGELRQVVLLYTHEDPPVVQAITENVDEMHTLLSSLLPLLPARVFLHLSQDLRPALANLYTFHSLSTHLKLVLHDTSALAKIKTQDVVRLTLADADDISAFYNHSYPGHWFQVRMLESGQYFGVRRQGTWAAVAGVHVYSPAQRVAALGNVVTRADLRGQGLATPVCAALCQSLLETTDTIGLNVQQDNAPALACYHRLGFVPVGVYEELIAIRKPM